MNKKKMSVSEKRDRLLGYVTAMPAMILLFIFTVYPVFYLLYYSMFSGSLISTKKTFVGLDNYKELFASETFHKVLLNTVVYTCLLYTSRIGRPEVSRLAAPKWRAGGSVVKGVKTQFTIFYIFHPFVAIRSVLCYNCIIWYMNIIFRKKCPGLLIWTCGNIRSVGTDPNSRGFWEREKR